jgi:UDP-N-acetylmuramate--alanine ligase
MTASLLRGSGVDASLVLGGIDVNTGSNAHNGSAPWFLTEADESDGSFSLLEPTIAVVTNIENDHLSSDAELPKLIASFDRFLERLPEDGVAVVGVDNPQSASIANSKRRARTVTFGIAEDAGVRAANIRFADLGSSFDVIAGGVCLGNVQLHVPGAINIENALAAIAVGRAIELPFVRIAASLSGFRGVRRRFEILAKTPRMIVVDDYAHHPTAVRATITAARQYHRGPVVVAFQPHRYTRTAYLAAAFADALRGADTVYLAPVYAASEPAIEGVSERSIGEPLRAAGTPVHYVNYVHDLRAALQREAPPNALVLMLGAGNITKVAADLARDVVQPAA